MDLDPASVKKLFAAIENGNPTLAVQLVSCISSRDLRRRLLQARKPHSSNQGDTPVHIAARLGQLAVLQVAFENGVDLCMLNYHRKQPLHEATQTGQPACVAFLLGTARVPVDPLKRADWTPLMLACAGSVREGIVTSYSSTEDRPSSSYVECVKLLLDYGADSTFVNKDGWNCLHLACRADCHEIVRLLIQRYPDSIYTRTANGRTCLHCLASSVTDVATVHRVSNDGSCCVAHLLLHAASSLLLVPDACGTLPIFDALRRGHVRLASIFLEHSPQEQLTACDKLGQQAVHVSAEAGQLQSVQLIVDHLGPAALLSPIKPSSEPQFAGVTPLHLACRSGQPEVAQYIIQSSYTLPSSQCETSPVDVVLHMDGNGHSPIWYAVIGAAGSGSSSIEQRMRCANLIWDAAVERRAMGDNNTMKLLSTELNSLKHLDLPQKMMSLVTNMIKMCYINKPEISL